MKSLIQITKKVTVAICIVTLTFSSLAPFATKAHAQEGAVSSAIAVPISTGFDYNITMDHVKKFVLDGLAWHIAKIMVQQITASTVQWINSGFQGSPSFLTNPAGYFANLGDQVTGMFIADTGILSGLCSPFNVDLRLALALGQAGYGEVDKYTCTLNSVINNVKNSTVEGKSIGGFMSGDFSQGGWPAFIALSQPNNNLSGAYLQAHSDLLQRIGSRQGEVQQQLIQGSGFLSWQDCKDISSSDIQNVSAASNQVNNIAGTDFSGQTSAQLNSGTGFLTDNSSLQNQIGISNGPATAKDITAYESSGQGTISQNSAGTYQSCETKTPGSVINSSLEKVLGSGIDQLNLANSFNQIVDALLAQLVTQVLNKGLGSASQRSSGITQSYIEKLSAETNASSSYSKSAQDIKTSYAPYLATANQTITIYDQIITMLDTTKSSLGSAATCLENLDSNPSYSSQYRNQFSSAIFSGQLLSQVNSTVSELNAAEAPYQTAYQQAKDSMSSYEYLANETSSASDPTSLQTASDDLQTFLSEQVPIIQSDSQTAQTSLTAASALNDQYATKAKDYIDQCKQAGGSI
jgi:hypothetical protein